MEEVKPIQAKPVVKEEPKPTFSIDKNTVMYILYLLYKNHILTRNHLKSIFKIVQDPIPENLVKWLVEESQKE